MNDWGDLFWPVFIFPGLIFGLMAAFGLQLSRVGYGGAQHTLPDVDLPKRCEASGGQWLEAACRYGCKLEKPNKDGGR